MGKLKRKKVARRSNIIQKGMSQNGITLIALIITIIVLLILAGVSLSLIVGQNGVLNKATDSVVATKKGTAVEQVSLAWSACQTDYLGNNDGSEKSTFFTKEKMNENLSQGEVISVDFEKDENGSEVVYKLENKNYTVQISSDGEVKVKSEGTDVNPPVEEYGAEDIANSTTCPTVMENDVVVDYLEYTPIDSSKATENGKSTDWQVLYADSNNIYLIMKYSTRNSVGEKTLEAGVGSDYTTGSAMLSDIDTNPETQRRFPAVKAGWFSKWMDKYKTDNTWTSSSNYMQATMYMLDSNLWNIHVFGETSANDYANWSIGGPTMEMLTKSYDKIQENTNKYGELEVEEKGAKGYNCGDADTAVYIQTGMLLNNGENFWIACPSSGRWNEIYARFKFGGNEH